LAHYSRFIQRGARVFATHGDLPDVDHIAAQNPDGTRALVLTNRGQGQRVRCAMQNKSLQVDLPADSVTTLVL
jgi:O-glycosyl hydrolase